MWVDFEYDIRSYLALWYARAAIRKKPQKMWKINIFAGKYIK